VIEKLEGVATVKYGAKFNYSNGVEKIVCENDKVVGIELEDGTFAAADIVVSNVDLVTTYRKLLPPGDPYVKRLENLKLTSSTFSFYWCMKQKIPQLEGHNIFLAGDYKESFDVIFDSLDLPADPSFYVHGKCFLIPSSF
jgi:phytoene desaturase (3,4-didehydrolycopene-forming)